MTATAGTVLAARLRRYFSVGPRTRRYRTDRYKISHDLHADMIEALMLAAQYPGCYADATQAAFQPGFGAALAYEKHVGGYRIPGALAGRINSMTPWQFAGLLGRMVDAGVECTGDGERFFAAMNRELRDEATTHVR
jgi:hypothetical protein